MGVPVSSADYSAGEYAIGADVEADIDAIIAEMNASIDKDNLAANAVESVAIKNDAVDANKIKDGNVRETHMDYDEDTSGALVMRSGPNYADAGNSRSGRRIACVSKEVEWATSPQEVTFTYENDCVDGNPAFTGIPNLLGAPIVASVESANANIITWRVTVSTSALITMILGFTADTDTVQIEFGVSGPV